MANTVNEEVSNVKRYTDYLREYDLDQDWGFTPVSNT